MFVANIHPQTRHHMIKWKLSPKTKTSPTQNLYFSQTPITPQSHQTQQQQSIIISKFHANSHSIVQKR